MEVHRKSSFPLLVITAVLATGAAASGLRAATGDVLIAFEAYLGTLPEGQGWTHEGRSLATNCPATVGNETCRYQGSQDLNYDLFPDNNCLPGIGCHKKQPFTEHYNSPHAGANSGSNTYTEWLAFDDGNNAGSRPLTIPDSTIIDSPPWGAPTFLHAPAYPPLRVVTGDGNNLGATLPAGYLNYRNTGKTKLRRQYNPGSANAFTLLVKAAAGPRAAGRQFVELRAFQRRFCFGVDGTIGSPTYGRLTLVSTVDENNLVVLGTLFDRTVMVGQPGTTGPHSGEFFTLRVIVRADGTFDAYLNETEDLHESGSSEVVTPAPTPANELQLTPIPGDDTMWFDLVQLFEGEVPVTLPDPTVDVNRDGQVNQADLDVFHDCSNGPGIPMLDTFECRCLDVNDDSVLDMSDFAVLQRCFTVAGPLDPTCDD